MVEPKPEAPAKWLCKTCGHIMSEPLEAKNPFDLDDIIHGCPECKTVGDLFQACQYAGCENEASGGHPGVYGYRYIWLCWDHSPHNPLRKTVAGFPRGRA